ncbi:MAG TPA: sugar porter family MFS transporter [Candidatus Sulfotelmatobacter sp.]|nr:sugar porter family MFS transporter [Candidatus Sulfotelmatobacter sp.]
MTNATSDAQLVDSGSQRLNYVVLLATVTAISGFLFGYNTAVINGVLLFLRHHFTPSDLQSEIAASAILVGALLGAASASVIGDRYGRKKSLIFSAVLFAITPLAAAAVNSVALFSLARLSNGLAIGLASVLTPVYIAEISPAKNRGALVSLNQLGIVLGILAAYIVGWWFSGLGGQSWRWMLAVAAGPALVFFVGLFAIPESPRWLISRGQMGEAMQTMVRLLGEREAAAEARTANRSAAEEKGSWRELLSGDMRKRLRVGMVLALFSQITGVNAVLYYGSVIISEHFPAQSAGMALASNVIIGLVNVIATILAMNFVDRWGRRAILMTASGGMAVALTVLVVGLNVAGAPPYLMLASVLLYVAFFAFGMGPGPWLIISEIFPTKIRGRAAAVATSMLWSGALLVTFTFLSLVRVLKVWGTFAVFGTLSLVCFLYVWKMVPETKGRTLEEIEECWSKS